VGRVVLLGAYQADVVYSQPVHVTGFASEAGKLDQLGVETSDYQGATGIVGVLASRFEEEGMPVVSLWVGLPHYINASPNPRGALALVQKLAACLEFSVDEKPLRARATAFEERISKLVSSDSELSEYVKQLKKREFSQ
jgi:predicted ATP-grasp superfamily ATP-dependent carboligase